MMVLQNKIYRQVLATFLIAIVVILGIFKFQILENLTSFVRKLMLGKTSEIITEILTFYHSTKSDESWIAHYIIYYPGYLICHFGLIQLLFFKDVQVKNLLTKSLIVLLAILIFGKFIAGYFQIGYMEEYFSFAFHKLIGLPFLLLAIEGGRYIYFKLDNLPS